MNKLKEYDGIIISTPVYMTNLSGKLKVFIDRTCRWFHRPELVGYPTLFVATTAGSGLKETFSALQKIVLQWGAFPTGEIGRTFVNINTEVREKEIASFIKHIHMEKNKYKPTLNQLITFQVQKVLALKVLPFDRRFWEEKNWISKDYFFDVEISVIKKIISRMFYKMLYRKIEPVNNK